MKNLSGESLGQIVPKLLDWYHAHARILPWREDHSPYRVWVSEIMLQQTRVEAVKPYFSRFLTALPDVQSLADAEEEQLLKLWEGLGYYNRVRNMQKAAKEIVEHYNGEFPKDYDALCALPGLGAYTAGAVASIAFSLPVPAVDGNVLRVISRITGDERDITIPAVKRDITKKVTDILPEEVGDFNQALMELGAMVCLPNGAPKCEECPVASMCMAYQKGLTDTIPVKKKKKPRRIEERTVFLIIKGQEILIRKRPDTGILAGLWEFPNTQEDAECFLDKIGIGDSKKDVTISAKHIFTHLEWHMTGYIVRVQEKIDGVWIDGAQLSEYAFPTALKKYVEKAKEILK